MLQNSIYIQLEKKVGEKKNTSQKNTIAKCAKVLTISKLIICDMVFFSFCCLK